jgi:hypothetical protein
MCLKSDVKFDSCQEILSHIFLTKSYQLWWGYGRSLTVLSPFSYWQKTLICLSHKILSAVMELYRYLTISDDTIGFFTLPCQKRLLHAFLTIFYQLWWSYRRSLTVLPKTFYTSLLKKNLISCDGVIEYIWSYLMILSAFLHCQKRLPHAFLTNILSAVMELLEDIWRNLTILSAFSNCQKTFIRLSHKILSAMIEL